MKGRKWRCSECAKLYAPLRRRTVAAALENRHPNTANKFLSERQRMKKLEEQRKEIDKTKKQVTRLRDKMQAMIKKEGCAVEPDIGDALNEILRESNISPAQSIFFQQQVKASQQKNACAMRWHPTMIRLALAIHLTSPSAYELIRDTGMIKLPGSRTLLEYSHASRIKEGIDDVVIDNVAAQVKKISEEVHPTTNEKQKHIKYHVLMADEMHISQNLVFQKSTE